MEFVSLTKKVEIGANSYLLRLGKRALLLDAGLHPKATGFDALPNVDIINDVALAGIVITHAHQDHVGSLPFVTRKFPNVPVFMSEATYHLADIMLHNSVNVMLRQRDDEGVSDYPLFTHRSVDLSRQMWQRRGLNRPFAWDGELDRPQDDISIEFFEAGHILGSVGVLIHCDGKKIFYTGDVQFDSQTLMRGCSFPESDIDVLIMETTRGDSPTPAGFTRDAEKRRLANVINNAFERGACATIPVFALGKTQELLAMFWEMKGEGLLPNVPIYIGGLSTKITDIYDATTETTQRHHHGLRLLQELAPYVVSGNDIASLRPRKRCIFALSSGMMSENTLSNIFARYIVEDPKQSILFVGYSDPQSPAGILRNTPHGEAVSLEQDLPAQRRLCHIDEFNFSAHARRESLLDYAIKVKPKTILLVHGDQPAIGWFQSELSKHLPNTQILVPLPGEPISL